MIRNLRYVALVAYLCAIIGCASHSDIGSSPAGSQKPVLIVPASYTANEDQVASDVSVLKEREQPTDELVNNPEMQILRPIKWPDAAVRDNKILGDMLAEVGEIEVATEMMPLRDFVNYTFGELLGVSYVIDENISKIAEGASDEVTLNLAEPVSPRVLFSLATDILSKRGVEVVYGSDTFFINRPDKSGGSKRAVIGVGRNKADVPNTVQSIVQVVPLEYGIKLSVERTLRSLLKAKITPDFEQSAIFIEGSRQEILHALELIDLLDTPATRSQYVGLIGLDFLTPEDFTRDVALLLENEGVIAAIGKPAKRNVVMVPLQQLGAVAVFAVSESLLMRVRQWAELIDVPGEGSNEQYFVFHPTNARAVDLGESVAGLLGSSSFGGNAGTPSRQIESPQSTGNAPSSARKVGINLNGIRMVVDERANALIFFTSGSKYRALLPLMNKLDTMPQQVLLDITIAEVTLKDEFKYGVEWALSRGEVNVTTAGAFGVASIGGVGVMVNGAEGPLDASFLDTNSLVNVLSKPSLLVRDGVTANINVGSDISVVGETTTDPINGERQTTSSQYRKTGVDVTVTPTVNSRGVVVMDIQQTISNTVPSSSGASGNPDIFERSLTTELVARSGQTVMMAGLISETSSKGDNGAPGISRIPLLGALFKSASDSSDRTELVMLITPRVIQDLSEWSQVMDSFRAGLRYIELEPTTDPD